MVARCSSRSPTRSASRKAMRHWRRTCSIGCPKPRSIASESAARTSASRTRAPSSPRGRSLGSELAGTSRRSMWREVKAFERQSTLPPTLVVSPARTPTSQRAHPCRGRRPTSTPHTPSPGPPGTSPTHPTHPRAGPRRGRASDAAAHRGPRAHPPRQSVAPPLAPTHRPTLSSGCRRRQMKDSFHSLTNGVGDRRGRGCQTGRQPGYHHHRPTGRPGSLTMGATRTVPSIRDPLAAS